MPQLASIFFPFLCFLSPAPRLVLDHFPRSFSLALQEEMIATDNYNLWIGTGNRADLANQTICCTLLC